MRFTPLWSLRVPAVLCMVVVLSASGSLAAREKPAASTTGFRQPDAKSHPDLFVWTDTCNVYVLRDGDAALLIDLGDGSVLDHLAEIGVKHVKWLLLTHHHREQCQGIGRVDRAATKVAAPKAEQALFETPTEFRKWYPTLGDKFSVYGASYARPPRVAIPLDKTFETGEVFTWRGHEIRCLSTPGHSPGSMTYMTRRDGKVVAFTGGVMHDGAKMTTWFDTEWDYGFAKGVDTLIASVQLLIDQQLDMALPSHGPAIRDPRVQLATYREKLTAFRQSYIRGYPVFKSTEQERDSISKPTAVPLISQVTPHLYKLSHKTQGKNFAIIVSDNGKGLVLDCGLFPEAMLDEIVLGMREHLGLKQIDAFWISHMHGDHFLLGPALKRKYGAQAWTLDRIADKCEHPRRYDYAALVSAYGDGFDGMKIEKPFRDGETVQWEGYTIHVDWMPGQTEFGCCLWLELDGKRIAFTGDNLFGNPADATQNGHEAVVARNSAIFEEGYLYGSRYLKNLKPDIVMGSHSYVMHDPAEFLSRYHEWSKQIIDLYRGLLPDEDYEYLFDPYWVSAYPYRVDFSNQDVQRVTVTVRNFRDSPQRHRVELKLPPGVTAEPAVLVGTIAPESRQSYQIELTVDRGVVPPGVQIVPFDITLDDRRYGELFDFLILNAETIIRTVAGNGRSAISTLGKPPETSIGNPFGVEIGPDGSLYICEVENHRVLRLDLSKKRLFVVAGTGQRGYSGDSGPATAAKINEPYEIRFAANGDMYFVEMRNHIVRKVDASTGTISTVAGTGAKGYSGDDGPATEARLNNPHSIALDDRSLFIADIGNHRIRRVDLESGKIESIAGSQQPQLPVDGGRARGKPVLGPRALFLQDDSLWVALREGHSVWRLDLSNDLWHHVAGTGKKGYTGDGGDAKQATFNGPKGIAVGPSGKVFVVDTENQAIRVIDLKLGTVSTLAGSGPTAKGFRGDGGLAGRSWLNRPHGICVAKDGTIFIGDSENHRVRSVHAVRGERR